MLRFASLFIPELTPNLVALSKHLDALHDFHGEFYVVAKSPYLVYTDGRLCSNMVKDPCIILNDLDEYPCELQYELGFIASRIRMEHYTMHELMMLDAWGGLAIQVVDDSLKAHNLQEA